MRSGWADWKVKVGGALFYVLMGASCMLLAFSTGPPAGRTGDFGEANCTACHTGSAVNSAGGTLTISGVPPQYTPGQTYPITVTISRTGQRRWGFQLSTRIVSGATQAGTLIVTNPANTQIVTENGIQYIGHTEAGTQLNATQGTWTFNWRAPSTAVGTVRFSAAGNAANGNSTNQGDFVYTTSVTTSAAAPTTVTGLFSQVAVGGGYSTVFSLTNTGSDALSGNLILTRADGTPLDVTLSSQSAPGAASESFASSASVSVAPGGTKFFTATAPTATDVSVGWARVESSGGQLSGVATFQQRDAGGLRTIVGVTSGELEDVVTIPVNDDSAQSRFTGYAIANPGTDTVRITIFLVDGNGTVTRTLSPAVTLEPGKQVARFLFQDVNDPNFKFQGSAVLRSETASKFAVTALVQAQDPNLLFSSTPVIKGKSSSVGN